jgi:pre-mRNA-splicing factor ATP-dependent RNA helicase DHX15/PRP43
MENPYLANLSNGRKGGTPKDGVSGPVHPLHGWTPRKVTAERVRRAMNSDVNSFTKQPVSATYKRIMESRKKLPVYGFMQTFYGIVGASEFGCLEGT